LKTKFPLVFWKGILKELEPHGFLENSGFTLKREPSWIFWKKIYFGFHGFLKEKGLYLENIRIYFEKEPPWIFGKIFLVPWVFGKGAYLL
jgi:hypothetical protein